MGVGMTRHVESDGEGYGESGRSQEFIAAMSQAVTQVTVVASDGEAGRVGVTVSAFSSVSAEPPLLLVCINRQSPAVAVIEQNRCFSVNLLNEAQSEVADSFAGRTEPQFAYDFSCADWTVLMTGAPLLVLASANFDCALERAFDAGTHRVCLGRVEGVRQSGRAPLAYSGRVYHKIQPLVSSSI